MSRSRSADVGAGLGSLGVTRLVVGNIINPLSQVTIGIRI